MSAGPTFGIKDYERMMGMTAVFHYVQPAVMRWIKGMKSGVPKEELALLEATAFDRGCSKGMNTTHWRADYKRCVSQHKDRYRKQQQASRLLEGEGASDSGKALAT